MSFKILQSLLILLLAMTSAHALDRPTVILVDKKTNRLKVAHYSDQGYEVIREYHAVVGKVVGDKEEEGDLKTPEGIYFFQAKLHPPAIKPKFGVMAFTMDYPNPWDLMAGRTGNDIMLHATNEPDRLQKNYDSEGCVVLKNEEISEVQNYIRLRLTPIIVFSDLSDPKNEYLKPAQDFRLKNFFQSWIEAWEGKNLDQYIDRYHSHFKSQGMNRAAWKTYKGNLNQRYEKIQVQPTQVQYFTHPKYSVIMFKQNYRSTIKGGGAGFVSVGTKTLYVAEEDGSPKIIDENFSRGSW